ncbi:hypothetical protein GGI20_005535 [Coemansia sp. BCRC 34301]|nr:hypothetical protein GGI20_005535 [Coemansia sp. BCRC 34301]
MCDVERTLAYTYVVIITVLVFELVRVVVVVKVLEVVGDGSGLVAAYTFAVEVGTTAEEVGTEVASDTEYTADDDEFLALVVSSAAK